MSEELEEVVDESTADQPTEEVVDQKKPVEEQPKNEVDEDGTIKLDLSNLNKIPNPPETTEEPVEKEVEEVVEEVAEEVVEEKQEEQPVLEEIQEEEVQEQTEQLAEEVEEAVAEAEESGVELPENIQKAVDFMNETGGNLEDYVRLNQDFSSFNDDQLLKEYYKQTKPHLSNDEIDFMIDDSFSFDEEEDTEREIKRKKLALKEQVASAKSHLDGQKSKYYEEIKIIKKAMYKVINNPKGTAWKSRVNDESFAISGKTGTSQVRIISQKERESGIIKNKDLPFEKRDHALFIGFAPFNDPKYITTVILEHAGGGASKAAPLARDLLLKSRKIIEGIDTDISVS